MKKVYIKYNPYILKTDVKIDGNELKQNSNIREWSEEGNRLQEWIEKLPKELESEMNDTDFTIEFHGTNLDYDDVVGVFENKDLIGSNVRYSLKHLNPNTDNSSDAKMKTIKNLFAKIQDGPIKELKDDAITDAFNKALNNDSDFEICVVATMSAGKSTLINSLLGEELMPSQAEACTAIITKIKDTNNPKWTARVYGKDGRELSQYRSCNRELTGEDMEELNKDSAVNEIHAEGNIPFVNAEQAALTLIDTPGRNNARDVNHRITQERFLSKNSKSLVIYIMESTFGTDDDNSLLEDIKASVSAGGKQARDRFLFVVNKVDTRNPKKDGKTEDFIERIKDYLEKDGNRSKGIKNPNIFPAAALPALQFRMYEKNPSTFDEFDIEELETFARRLNRFETFHLEKFANLPISIKSEIIKKGEQYKAEGNKYGEALIHTGIPSIEAAIKQYVEKYSKTAKIKNVVEPIENKLTTLESISNLEKDLIENKEAKKTIISEIKHINGVLKEAKNAKNMEFEEIKKEKSNELIGMIEDIVIEQKYILDQKLKEYDGKGQVKKAYVRSDINELENIADKAKEQIGKDIKESIEDGLKETLEDLLTEYKAKIANLTKENSDLENVSVTESYINPLKIVRTELSSLEHSMSLENYVKEQRDFVGTETRRNDDWKWYNPISWFREEKYYEVDIYETNEYVNISEYASDFLTPISTSLEMAGQTAITEGLKEINKMVVQFNKEVTKIDSIIEKEMNRLENFANDKENIEARINNINKVRKYLAGVKKDLNTILEV